MNLLTSSSKTISSSATVDPSASINVSALVSSLRNTFNQEKTRSISWRRQQLESMKAMLSNHQEEFVEAVMADTGRSHFEAWAGDLAMSLAEINVALKGLKKWMAPRRLPTPEAAFPGGNAELVPAPLGVTLVIAPWNYPLELALNPVVGAIAAGNCVLIKPSELAPRTSALLARRVPEYMDSECIAVVEGGVPETQALLQERFDHIFYTGNSRVARIVLAAAAPNLTPVTLELGGKSPCIVAHDANLKVIARRICFGKFYNVGQTCVAPDYILVDNRVKTELIEHLKNTIEQFYGQDPKTSSDYGRVANDRHYERLIELLEGQQPVIGGQADPKQRYIAPTILSDVSVESKVMQEEIFGPILPVIGVSDLEEAVAFVNARPKPLGLYVFTSNRNTERNLLSRMSAGGACVNTATLQASSPKLPFGGVGESGMGRYKGRYSFELFSHYMTVVRQTTAVDLPLIYPPITSTKLAIIKRLI